MIYNDSAEVDVQRDIQLQKKVQAGGHGAAQQKSRRGEDTEAVPAIVHEVLSSPGLPLHAETRHYFEQRFGHDFSQVRVHADTKAAQSATAVNALAYTVGRDVVFGAGRFAPATTPGDQLLAHELTHVIQQTSKLSHGATIDTALETEAACSARMVSDGSEKIAIHGTAPIGLARAAAFPGTPDFDPTKRFTAEQIQKLKGFGEDEYRVSVEALKEIFNRTGGYNKKAESHTKVTTRQAAGELTILMDTLNNRAVTAVKVVPSSSEARSPDFYCVSLQVNPLRVEVVNLTAAKQAARPTAHVDAAGTKKRGKFPTDANTKIRLSDLKRAIKSKIAGQTQFTSKGGTAVVNGEPMAVGGKLVVKVHGSLPHAQVTEKVIKPLQADLIKAQVRMLTITCETDKGRVFYEYEQTGEALIARPPRAAYKRASPALSQGGTSPEFTSANPAPPPKSASNVQAAAAPSVSQPPTVTAPPKASLKAPKPEGERTATVGISDMRIPQAGGPSARGVAVGGGISLAFQGINIVLSWINDWVQARRVGEALATIEPGLLKTRTQSPSMGVQLVFFYTQVQAPPESIMQPGAVYDHIEVSTGRTQDEADEKWKTIPGISHAAHGRSRLIQKVWIPPLEPARVAQFRSPFPSVAIGTFAAGQAKIQGVEWAGVFGFDDMKEATLAPPPGMTPQFLVMKLPQNFVWFNGPMPMVKIIPVEDRSAAEGGSIPVVNLDVSLQRVGMGKVAAACVFPCDDSTAELFNETRPTFDETGQIKAVNFGMARWVRPENIKVLRRL